MALGTVSKVLHAGRSIDGVQGDRRVVFRDVQLTSGANYTTGGEPLPLANLGLKVVFHVSCDGGAKNAAGTLLVPVRFDLVANKIQAFRYDGASVGKAFLEEVAAATDLSTFTVRLRIEGRIAS